MTYLIYPKALEKLETSGINKRIKNLYLSDDAPYFCTYYFEDEVRDIISEMKKSGHIQTMPKTDETKKYRKLLNQFFLGEKEMIWNVNGSKRIVDIHIKLEEIVLFLGYPSSHILTPDEIWDYKKFGFSTQSEFVGIVGAQITNHTSKLRTKGLIWESKNKNKSLENEILGSEHADLRVFQTDISQYKTKDPFGNKTLFRKINLGEDKLGIYGYHSEEINLLVGILKYINQENITSQIIKDPNSFFNSFEIKNRKIETLSGSGSLYRTPNQSFICFDKFEHPNLDVNLQYFQRPKFHINMEREGFYSMFVDSNKDLVFSQMNNLEEIGKLENISCRFTTNDVDKLIEGIFTQAINYGGRTHPYELLNVFNYYLDNFYNP